jgi:multimeric flavodoxin WrbA
MPSPELNRAEFEKRFLGQFQDPGFAELSLELERVTNAAWEAYSKGRKTPRTRQAGPQYANPNYDLSIDWIRAREAIHRAQREYEDPQRPPRVLLINGSSRSEHTCPGEMSKSYRLMEIARETFAATPSVTIEELDVSRLSSEYGRNIHPCKACFSTAAALCHWPCSCYPNYGMGQTQDWMNEIYPMWVAAHGVLIITPVNWFQVSSPIKLMMDRLVCADGGNPDPTRTEGKDAALAKQIELEGWPYEQHLKGRLFSVIVHGDVEGAENVRRRRERTGHGTLVLLIRGGRHGPAELCVARLRGEEEADEAGRVPVGDGGGGAGGGISHARSKFFLDQIPEFGG